MCMASDANDLNYREKLRWGNPSKVYTRKRRRIENNEYCSKKIQTLQTPEVAEGKFVEKIQSVRTPEVEEGKFTEKNQSLRITDVEEGKFSENNPSLLSLEADKGRFSGENQSLPTPDAEEEKLAENNRSLQTPDAEEGKFAENNHSWKTLEADDAEGKKFAENNQALLTLDAEEGKFAEKDRCVRTPDVEEGKIAENSQSSRSPDAEEGKFTENNQFLQIPEAEEEKFAQKPLEQQIQGKEAEHQSRDFSTQNFDQEGACGSSVCLNGRDGPKGAGGSPILEHNDCGLVMEPSVARKDSARNEEAELQSRDSLTCKYGTGSSEAETQWMDSLSHKDGISNEKAESLLRDSLIPKDGAVSDEAEPQLEDSSTHKDGTGSGKVEPLLLDSSALKDDMVSEEAEPQLKDSSTHKDGMGCGEAEPQLSDSTTENFDREHKCGSPVGLNSRDGPGHGGVAGPSMESSGGCSIVELNFAQEDGTINEEEQPQLRDSSTYNVNQVGTRGSPMGLNGRDGPEGGDSIVEPNGGCPIVEPNFAWEDDTSNEEAGPQLRDSSAHKDAAVAEEAEHQLRDSSTHNFDIMLSEGVELINSGEVQESTHGSPVGLNGRDGPEGSILVSHGGGSMLEPNGDGPIVGPDVEEVGDGSCGGDPSVQSNRDAEVEGVNRLVKPLVSRVEDRVRINLTGGRSTDEIRDLRSVLEGKLDQIRSLVAKLEAKELQLTTHNSSTNGGRISAIPGRAVNYAYSYPQYMDNNDVIKSRSHPFQPPRVAVVSNNGNGVAEFVEKRTPKANPYYRNSDFFLEKDRLPPPESNKKLKPNGYGFGFGFGFDKHRSQVFKKCGTILQRLMKHKNGWIFNKPVDVVALNLHDYFDMIKNPMDLGTIKKRLSQKWYKTPREFAEDVRLVFSNAMTYNPKGHDVHVMSEELLKIFEEKFAVIEAEFNPDWRNQMYLDAGLPSPTLRKVGPPNPRAPQVNEFRPKPARVAHVGRVPVPKKPKANDPNKRDMTNDEKQRLSTNLQNLPSEKLDAVVQIIKKRSSSISQHEDEIEVDIDSVDAETLWELDRFVTNYKKNLSKYKRKAELALQAGTAPVMNSAHSVAANPLKKSKTGANNTSRPATNGEVERQVDGSRSSSSSSSSSDSGSSSSDSDSDSSSGDESEAS